MMGARERENTVSRKVPAPNNEPMQGRKRENSGVKKYRSKKTKSAELLKPASTTPSNTEISIEIRREAQRSCRTEKFYAARRHKRVSMSNPSTTSNMHQHIRQMQCTAERMHSVHKDISLV